MYVLPALPMQVSVTSCRTKLSGISELLTAIRDKVPLETEPYGTVGRLKIAPQPFSDQGAARWPFYALRVGPAGGAGSEGSSSGGGGAV